MTLDEKPKTVWELSFGFYPGILIGIRTYIETYSTIHTLYLPFINLTLEIEK